MNEIVGWVEEKRVLSLRVLPKPIADLRRRMMGFAITREERIIALPILLLSEPVTVYLFREEWPSPGGLPG